MADFDVDPEIDDLVGTEDIQAETSDVPSYPDVAADGTFDLEQPPDPFTSPDAPVHFAGTVTFPDGSSTDHARIDSLGYAYKTDQDWIGGVNKHVVDKSGNATPVD